MIFFQVRHFLNFILLPISLFFVLFSCSAKDQYGYAPSSEKAKSENFIRYGATKTTSSGWTIDQTVGEVIQSKTLNNGWSIDVRYE